MENQTCCRQKNNDKKGLIGGLISGLAPHTFCIAFIVFSMIGASSATLFFKRFLMTPYLFQGLIAVSFLFATISAVIYLRKTGRLSAGGIKSKWKYLSVLYSTTIMVNLLLFLAVFPALANMKSGGEISYKNNLDSLSIEVQIPCSGHAPLVIDELKNNAYVESVKFHLPNVFEIKYDPDKTSPEKITSLEIFDTYKATIQ
jgi:hypothetical protein